MFLARLGRRAENRDADPVTAHPLFCANAECAAVPRKTIKKPGASFPSSLRAPIQIESLGLWPASLTRDEIIKQLSEHADEKLNALMKHYNIPLHSHENGSI